MGFLLKIGNLFVGQPLGWLNGVLDGKKTFLGAILIALPALMGIIKMSMDLAPLDLNDIMAIVHSPYIRQLGEAIAIFGGRAALGKIANGV